MIRFKPNPGPSPEDSDVNVRTFLDRERRRANYKRVLKIASGASREKFVAAARELDRYLVSTRSVPTNILDWKEVATLAGRVEREARKLRAASEVRRLERALVKDGLATRVKGNAA